jgi:nickel-dependent lactate racemase
MLLGEISSKFSDRFFIHDAIGDPTFFSGNTSRGTRVEVSKRLLDYENVVTIGSVEPHWFAGYTGGRKSLVPGVASFETIRQNHSLALGDGVGPLITSKNPLFEDLNEATTLILENLNDIGGPVIRSINCVAHKDDIFSISSSTVIESINPLISDVNKIFRKYTQPTDIVIAIACAPMDRDLYQAMKSFENVRSSLRQKASFILVASCPEGIGPPHFSRTMALSKKLDLLKEHLSGEYTLGDHKFKNPLRFIEGGGVLSLVSKNIAEQKSSEEVGLFSIYRDINPVLDKEIDRIEKIKNGPMDILIITDAVNIVTFPVA